MGVRGAESRHQRAAMRAYDQSLSNTLSTVLLLALAMAVVGVLLWPVGGANACSSTCRSTDSDDSCLFCDACGNCDAQGFTTHCNQPNTVHLTIDDGPFDTSTVALDILKWKGVKATFFLLGQQIAGREAIVQRMIAEGHNIGQHSWSHPHFNTLTDAQIVDEISRTTAEIYRATNVTVTDLRPPFGELNLNGAADVVGWNVRLWNLDTLDYVDSMATLAAQVDGTLAGFDRALSGWVIGMHLDSNLGLCALPALIDRIRAKGYNFVTADECWGQASHSPISWITPLQPRVGIPAECNPLAAPLPLQFGSCSSSIGCWGPKQCCGQYGYCGNDTASCGTGCLGGWCASCQPWILANPNPPPVPNTPWPACTVSSPLFINACTTTPNGGCSVANTAACVMTGSGTRNCTCQAGWSGTTCTADVNECATNNGGCAAAATCLNTAGSRNCTCRAGFTGDGVTCANINECATANGGCAAEATCTDATPSSPAWSTRFTCSACPAGFNGTGQVGTVCTNVNECATANGGCSQLVTCTDDVPRPTNGFSRFVCGPCPNGYATASGGACVDVNECATANGGCSLSPAVTCWNSVGSYLCASGVNCTQNGGLGNGPAPCSACPFGFFGDGKNCTDINECEVANGGCAAEAVCTNTAGSRTCVCRAGTTGNGTACANVNECVTGNGGCGGATPICTDSSPAVGNAWARFACAACAAGFNGTVGACVDINECAAANGGCSKLPPVPCHNTNGSFYCAVGASCPTASSCPTCPAGFTGTGVVCTDTNECASVNGGCHVSATCTNTPGSRTCSSCGTGFAGDGLACANVNECAVDNGGCSALRACTDLVPSAATQWLGRACGDCALGEAADGTCLPDDCASSPCANAGTCQRHMDGAGHATGGYACACADGFTGPNCADVVRAGAADSGRIAAIAVPVVVVCVALFAVLAVCVIRRRRNGQANANASANAGAKGVANAKAKGNAESAKPDKPVVELAPMPAPPPVAAAGDADAPAPAPAAAAAAPHSPAQRSGAISVDVPRSPEAGPIVPPAEPVVPPAPAP